MPWPGMCNGKDVAWSTSFRLSSCRMVMPRYSAMHSFMFIRILAIGVFMEECAGLVSGQAPWLYDAEVSDLFHRN